MHIDWWTLGLQAINALVLIWLLARFLFRPVADMVAARRKAAEDLIAGAHAVKATADRELEEAVAQTRLLAEHRDEAFKEIEAQAAAEKKVLLAQAQAEAAALRLAAEREVAAARRADALNDADRTIRLAIDIAAKLLDRLPAEVRVVGFVDGLLAELAKLPESTRATLGADGAVLGFTVARALTNEQAQQCRAAISGALGRPVSVEWKLDSDLIAGLELETPHTVIRNSLRDDLNRIKTELLCHDNDPA